MTAVDLSSQTAPVTTRKTTTRKKLWIRCVVLLVATTVVFGTSLWVFQKVHGTVEKVRTSTAPAIIGVLTTWAALVEADSAAINSFKTGQAQLTGPGDQYQSQIAIAGRSLAQAAEDNSAGEDGSQRIQLVEGLLVSYQGLIGHADANFRKNEGSSLGTTDLWYASHLLHIKEESGILFQLNMLLEGQKSALDRQLSANSITVAKAILVWVPIVVLFVVLGATQIFLKGRFRRTLNPPLLLATVLLVGLSVVMSLTVVSQYRLQDSRTNLDQLAMDWGKQISAADAGGQRHLRDMVTRNCVQVEGKCGVTVTEFVAGLESEPADQAVVEIDVFVFDEMIAEVNDQIAAAGRYANLGFLIPLTTGLIAVLILLGLLPRIGEYRYRPR